MQMTAIPEILSTLKRGGVVVVCDDTDRENEGDLVAAGEHATPDVINFMLTHGRGMLFVAADPETCDRLDLHPPGGRNTTQRGTNYTISVDATDRFGVTTGVSAADRSATIRRLASPEASAEDFDRPGHVQPLRARDGGTLVRAGHTEALVDLMRAAGLRPVSVGIEVMNPDGTMARRPELTKLCEAFDLPMCTVADVIEHRIARDRLVTRGTATPFTNAAGTWTLIPYASEVDPFPHVALVCGGLGERDGYGEPIEHDGPVLVRMHSQNLLGDVLGDISQPSGDVLRESMRRIQERGRGAVVYLRHSGMGEGVLKELQTARDAPATTLRHDHPSPGTGPARGRMDYGIGCQVLRDLGVRQIELLTSHTPPTMALAGFGLEIVGTVDPSA